MTIKVKSLVWEPYPDSKLAGPDVSVAEVAAVVPYHYQVQRDPWAPSFIAYAAPKFGTETWRSSGHPTLEAAKAAAQADYEARILSAIEAVDPAPIRAAALREAIAPQISEGIGAMLQVDRDAVLTDLRAIMEKLK